MAEKKEKIVELFEVDARGLSCPIPVVETKKALKANPDGIVVLVDNNVSKENVSRYATAMKYKADAKEENGTWIIEIKK